MRGGEGGLEHEKHESGPMAKNAVGLGRKEGLEHESHESGPTAKNAVGLGRKGRNTRWDDKAE